MAGKLLLLATPIGNLGDATPRLKGALAAADVIACEDTRRLAKLLAHLGVAKAGKKVVVYADPTEKAAAPALLRALEEGKTVALVTDAGTPLVADPGFLLVKKALAAGVEVDFIPGPSAVHAALVLSGLPPYPYTFLGYLPRRAAERRAFLGRYAPLPTTLVLFVTPHRLSAELADCLAAFGDRDGALARELTKVFQEVIRGKLSAVAAAAAERKLVGEMTLVVAPPEAAAESDAENEALAFARALVAEGVPKARAAAAAARVYKVPKNAVYKALAR